MGDADDGADRGWLVGMGAAMTPLESFLFLGATVGALWGLWLLLNLVFDLIEFWHDSLRAQQASADRRSREAVSPSGERGS